MVRRLGLAVTGVLALSLIAPAMAHGAGATTCTAIVPKHVVLRAQGIQSPYDVGAHWGSCPEEFKAMGYHTEMPDYGGHPITWEFTATQIADVPRYWNYGKPTTSGRIPITSFDGREPQVGDVGTGGDYSPRIPGRYRFSPSETTNTYVQTNYPDVRLRASNGFTAKYWSALGITATRDGGRTVVTLVGRKDTVVNGSSTSFSYPQGSMDVPASGDRVRLYRDGKLVRTLNLRKDGTSVVSLPSTKSKHDYRAVMSGSSINWPATASITTPAG
jgi:hypothetical protein